MGGWILHWVGEMPPLGLMPFASRPFRRVGALHETQSLTIKIPKLQLLEFESGCVGWQETKVTIRSSPSIVSYSNRHNIYTSWKMISKTKK